MKEQILKILILILLLTILRQTYFIIGTKELLLYSGKLFIK